MKALKDKLTLAQKREWAGRLFILPFTIGFLMFFFEPLMRSFYYSFNELTLIKGGYDAKWIGFENYMFAFIKDPDFLRMLAEAIQNMIIEVPVILMYSLFLAIILNQKFKGRTFVRALFFMPVIITSGVMISIIKDDAMQQAIRDGSASAVYLFRGSGLDEILRQTALPVWLIDTFNTIVSRVFDLLWKSGVQILLFLASLQSVPAQLYEASTIEGATAWENFWKVTFPMISPVIMVNIVYSVVDSFTDYNNELLVTIVKAGYEQMRYSYSSAMAWIYFICVSIILSIIMAIISRGIFYYTE